MTDVDELAIETAACRLITALGGAGWRESDDPHAFVKATSNLGFVVERSNGWFGLRFDVSVFDSSGTAHLLARLHRDAETAVRGSQLDG